MTTLTEFLNSLEQVSSTGDGWLALCPAHADHDPSLRVAVGKDGDKVLVKCRVGCETADVLKALSMSFADLASVKIDRIVPEHRRAISTDARPEVADIAAMRVLLDGFVEAARDHIEVRGYALRRFGISDETFDRLGFGYNEGRLILPFYDADGVAMGYQGRALDPAESLRWKGPRRPDGGGRWASHGYFEGEGGWSELLLTEGPGDGATAVSLGFDAVFLAGTGQGQNDAILDDVAAYAGTRKIIVCGDGDRAGQEFSTTVSHALVERGCTVAVLSMPTDMDLTDWVAADPSKRKVVAAIHDAQTLTTFTSATRSRDARKYPATDLGNGRFLRDHALSRGTALRYSPEAGWFILDRGVWRPDDLDAVRALAQEAAEVTADIARDMLRAVESQTPPDPDQERQAKAWWRHAQYSQSSKGIDSALRECQVQMDVATRLDRFDTRNDLLAVRNGVVNLRTGKLLPSDPDYLLTRRIDIDFDPSAKAPRWEQFLREIFPNHPDMPAYIQRLIGYGITGETAEQCFAVLWGKGANGKSVFTDTLTELFRESTVTTPFSTFEARPSGGIPNDIAALKGARLVMASEGEANRRMAEAVLKRITGRDLIAARFMRKEFFEFRPTFLLLLATNNKPEFRGQDEGLWRRVKLLPFERYFAPDERDHRLGDKLLLEAEGILAWAVAGAAQWYAKGLMDPATVIDATKEYRETSNALDGFLPGLWIHDDAARGVTSTELYLSYQEWCDTEGIRDPWTKRTFNSALEERGLAKRKTNKGVAFDGIRKSHTGDFPDKDGPAPAPKEDNPTLTPKPTKISGASLDAI